MSADGTPQVSVLLSVRNGLPYLQQTVASVLAQSFSDFEFVIVDNASTDGSRAFLEQVARENPGRVRLVLNERDLGHSGGLNRGLAECRAGWVARIDADDLALPNRLERQMAFIRENPDVRVTSCLAYYIDPRGRRRGKAVLDLTTREQFEHVMAHNLVIGLLHPCVMMRKDVVLEAGGYREQFKATNDVDLWNRISERGHLILVQPEYLMEYRIHPVSIGSNTYPETRLRYEWLRVCITARRSGKPEPDWETFLADWRSVGLFTRLNRDRKIQAKIFYRSSGENFIAGHKLRAGAFYLVSMLLQPQYSLRRLLRQIGSKQLARVDDQLPS